jgi:hypothetical protein
MTTPAKKYQNVSYKELLSYSEQNPNRTRTLASITATLLTQDTSLNKLGLKGYTAANITPSGIISLLATIADPSYYAMAPKHVRTQLIIDLSTSLQQQTDHLTNTSLSRKRKKIHDLIGAAYNGAAFQDKEYLELFHAISLMRNLHFVLMKEAIQDKIEDDEVSYDSALKGEIIFSSDPSTWKRENPIWVVDYRARWVAVPTEQNAIAMHQWIGQWLSAIEQKGWVIQWPEVDATKTELVEILSSSSDWKETDKKLSKETLAMRLSKVKAYRAFANWIKNVSYMDD